MSILPSYLAYLAASATVFFISGSSVMMSSKVYAARLPVSRLTVAMRCFCFFSVTFIVRLPSVCACVMAALHRTTPLPVVKRTSSEKLPPCSHPLPAQSMSGISFRKSVENSSVSSISSSRFAALLTQTGRKPPPNSTMLSALPSRAERMSSALCKIESLPSMPMAAARTTARV